MRLNNVCVVWQVPPSSPGKPGKSLDRPAKKFKDSLGRAKEATPAKPPKVRLSTGVCMKVKNIEVRYFHIASSKSSLEFQYWTKPYKQ